MKNLLNSLIILLIAFTFGQKSTAQTCEIPFFKEKAVIEMRQFSAKDKEESKSIVEVIKIDRTNANNIESTVKSTIIDSKKDKVVNEGEVKFSCKNGDFTIDLSSLIPPGTLEGFKDMELKADAASLILPKNLSAGQTLPDATMNIEIWNSGTKITTVTINVTNRKVVGKENLTVPAGTYEVFKITYDTEIFMNTMGIKIPNRSSTIDFFSFKAGSVRTETYTKGKLNGYSVLYSIK